MGEVQEVQMVEEEQVVEEIILELQEEIREVMIGEVIAEGEMIEEGMIEENLIQINKDLKVKKVMNADITRPSNRPRPSRGIPWGKLRIICENVCSRQRQKRNGIVLLIWRYDSWNARQTASPPSPKGTGDYE